MVILQIHAANDGDGADDDGGGGYPHAAPLRSFLGMRPGAIS